MRAKKADVDDLRKVSSVVHATGVGGRKWPRGSYVFRGGQGKRWQKLSNEAQDCCEGREDVNEVARWQMFV